MGTRTSATSIWQMRFRVYVAGGFWELLWGFGKTTLSWVVFSFIFKPDEKYWLTLNLVYGPKEVS